MSGNVRLFMLQAVMVSICVFLVYRLWELQIVNGPKYAEDYELKITRTVREGSTRGNIYDCNGEVLAYNELVFIVTMIDNGDYSSGRERQLSLNSMIYRVIGKLAEKREQVNNELKIAVGADGRFEYTVSGSALQRFLADIFGKADPEDLTSEQKRMSADEIIDYLAQDRNFALYGEGKKPYSAEELREYGLPEAFTKEEMLAILGIRYMLSANAYRKYVPVILARNVSEETAAYILENNQSLTGIDIDQDWERVYTGGEAFSGILGYTGRISAKELEDYADSGRNYTVDSVVGKAGIEQYLEEELQGIDGEKQIMVNNVGKIIGEERILRETVSGKDVYLSIDKNLQIAVYEILEKKLAEIIADHLIDAKTFDKTAIADTTDIRIPIYDVYMALIDNQIIRLPASDISGLTRLEQQLLEKLEQKREEVLKAIGDILLDGRTDYRNLPEEMQTYLRYLIFESGFLYEEAAGQSGKTLTDRQSAGIKEFLFYAADQGWIAAEFPEAGKKYLTRDELYVFLSEMILDLITNDIKFEELLLKQMILEDRISGKEICGLLYDQGVLSGTDDDYEKLVSGEIGTFSFLKKKIEQLEITPAQLALDPCSASAVVVNPENGKVLALVSYPGYDSNRLANQMDTAYYNRLLNDRSLPLYNRAAQQLTAPGSTLKPVTIVAGLQEGVISSDTSVFCDGIFDKVEPGLKCWKHTGHGSVDDARSALAFSCNDYLCEIAYRLGTGPDMTYLDGAALSKQREYASLFGLDEKSGVEIAESAPHVTDAYGIPSAIGQGTHNYATVQLARYVNVIASGGDIFSLSLIQGIADADGNFTEKEAVTAGRVEVPDSVWETVGSGMQQFARSNTVFRDFEILTAGKTGTAQESGDRPDHALFVGYAPADAPEITIAVRIANGYASSNVTAVGRSIFAYYFGLEDTGDV